MRPATVEQAGGDERAAFEEIMMNNGRDISTADGEYLDPLVERDWQARAALAQPSPKCEFCGGTGEISGVEGEDDWVNGPCPRCAYPAQAERPEVVAWRYGLSGGIVSDKACLDEWKSGGEYQSLMTVAQHERITAQLHDALDESDGDRWKLRSERDAANARLHEVATACATAEQERDAALARVAELERQEPVDVPGPDEIHQMAFEEGQPAEDGDGYLFSAEEFDLFVQRLLDSCATPVAWAQHSVPDGAADLCRFLAKLYCELDGLRYSTAKLPAEQIADALIFKWPVLQGARNQLNIKRISEQPYDESKLHSAIAAMLAAAPVKEG
ncbi:Uncharacterised protein [Pseudomonas aeruginosa]|nr:Uncharacterised protein [Pseudomonas aeruginosa]VEF98843.1 Uncharacterised protein [Pseudomonas aeruginosa]